MTSHRFLIFWTERSEENCARAKCSKMGLLLFSFLLWRIKMASIGSAGVIYLSFTNTCANSRSYTRVEGGRQNTCRKLYWVRCSLGCTQATTFVVANSLRYCTVHLATIIGVHSVPLWSLVMTIGLEILDYQQCRCCAALPRLCCPSTGSCDTDHQVREPYCAIVLPRSSE